LGDGSFPCPAQKTDKCEKKSKKKVFLKQTQNLHEVIMCRVKVHVKSNGARTTPKQSLFLKSDRTEDAGRVLPDSGKRSRIRIRRRRSRGKVPGKVTEGFYDRCSLVRHDS
jgi:hypothetical protein